MAEIAITGGADFNSLTFGYLSTRDLHRFDDNIPGRIAAAPALGRSKAFVYEDVVTDLWGSLSAPVAMNLLFGKGLAHDGFGAATAGRMTGFVYTGPAGFSLTFLGFDVSYVEFQTIAQSPQPEDDWRMLDQMLAGHDRISGDSHDDHLWGGAGQDSLFGHAGADTLYGDAGNDVIYGGADNDSLTGNLGNDTLYGGAGDDDTYGDAGQDAVYGEAGNDTIDGWTGNDRLYGGTGDDDLHGGDGNDTLTGGTGGDTLCGAAGNDKLTGDAGDDDLSGGTGTDSLMGGVGNDTVAGGADHDLLMGEAGQDLLLGDSGNDTLDGGAGADTLIGGLGSDKLIGGKDSLTDVFVFCAAAETTLGAGRDVVWNFTSGKDKFDVSDFDADSVASGHQAFEFNGSVAAAHRMWLVDTGADLLLRGDVSGDGVADFEILIKAINTLQGTDFLF